jgi:hypothetical protein
MINNRANALRVILALAAAYNFAFGVWASLFPLSFFRLFDLDIPIYPSIWACVGMVVGLYGIAYAYAALRPRRRTVLVWIGLAGKVFGPIGWLLAVGRGELPPRTFPIILLNDLVWLVPFLFVLIERVPYRRALTAWTCVAIHVVACFCLLAVRGGAETTPNVAERQQWIRQWLVLWVAAWLIWTLASMSLLAFVIVWAEQLATMGAARSHLIAAVLVVAAGVICDLSGETINIAWVTRPDQSVEDFTRFARMYAWLSACTANGLYCVVGLWMSCMAWRVGQLRGYVGLLGFIMWTTGLTLSVAVIADHRLGMVAAGAVTMIMFIPWAGGVATRLDRPISSKSTCSTLSQASEQ